MTTKEIAKAVNKDERSIQMWAKKLGEKNSAISEKISSSSSRYPADYTLDESCQIIEEGMGADVAAVYRTNAVNAALQPRPSKPTYSAAYLREYRLTHGVEAARALIDSTMPALPPPPTPIEDDYAALRAVVGDKGARQVIAVAHKVALAHNAAVRNDKIQPRLM